MFSHTAPPLSAPPVPGRSGPHPAVHPSTPSRGRRVRRALTATAAALLLGAAVAGCGGGSDSAAPASHTTTSAARRSTGPRRRCNRWRATASTRRSAPALRRSKLTGEFQAPDRVHESITLTGKAPVEVVFAGNQAFVKDATTGAWRNRVQATRVDDDRRARGIRCAHQGGLGVAPGIHLHVPAYPPTRRSPSSGRMPPRASRPSPP